MYEIVAEQVKKAIESETDLNKVKGLLEKVLANYIKTYKRMEKIVAISDRHQHMLANINERIKKEQELAYIKQKNLITNDYLDDPSVELKIIYRSADILSGDTYSIHKTETGEVFIYMMDAMGHGLLPSLTSFAIQSFIKQALHYVDTLDELLTILEKPFQTLLSDDEQLSVAFFLIDSNFSTLSYAMAGIYPAVFEDNNGWRLLRANNTPATNFMPQLKASTIKIDDFKKIVIYSDGLVEGNIFAYDEKNMNKLLDPNVINNIKSSIANRALEDDLTLIYMAKREIV